MNALQSDAKALEIAATLGPLEFEVQNATTALTDVQAQLQTAQQAADTAQAKFDAAQKDVEQAEQRVLDADVAARKVEADAGAVAQQAEQKVTAAQRPVADLHKQVDAAEAAVTEAVTVHDEAATALQRSIIAVVVGWCSREGPERRSYDRRGGADEGARHTERPEQPKWRTSDSPGNFLLWRLTAMKIVPVRPRIRRMSAKARARPQQRGESRRW